MKIVPAAVLTAVAVGVPAAVSVRGGGSEDVERSGWTRPPGQDPAVEAPLEPGAGEALAIQGALSHPWLFHGANEDVFLYVSLVAGEPARVERLPMNLALVIDRSGSMAGGKLEHAKQAAEQLLARLRPDDDLAIVAYDDVVRTLVPSTPARHRDVFTSAIRTLRPGGQTDLHGGLMAGYEEVLSRFDERRLNRVLLVSDGLANVGVTDRRAIAERAARCAERGVRISTMGVGIDYDEVLMADVARRAGGRYSYVDQPEAIAAHLDAEIDQLERTVARDLVVEIELGEGVALRELYGYPHDRAANRVTIPIRDLFAGERRKIVLRLGVANAGGSPLFVADTQVRYTDAATRARELAVAAPVTALTTANAERVRSERDAGVLAHVELVRNGLAFEEAMEHQRALDFERAQRVLLARHDASKALNETVVRSEELERQLAHMRHVAVEIERTRHDREAQRALLLDSELLALQALGYL